MRITEIFHSIQGEGIYMGLPMLFVRTNRCNLRCRWCDSKYTFTGGEEVDLNDILKTVRDSREEWVCFTGGEPLLQPEALEFVRSCIDIGKKVLIETSGSLNIKPYVFSDSVCIDMDVKTPSSGEEKSLLKSNIDLIRKMDYLKFVISDEADYEFSREFVGGLDEEKNVVFQPAWGSDARMLAEAVIRDGLNVRVMPQFHKMVWGDRRGV
ncbi:MAG: radical SAM protein [Thermoplasmataceae archaeon]